MTACRYAQPIDKVGTLTATQPKLVWKKEQSFKQFVKRVMVVSALASTAATPIASAASSANQVNAYRVYAHSHLQL
jgi:hypothetical protein